MQLACELLGESRAVSLCFQVLCASGHGALANVTRVLGQDLRGDTAEDLTARVTVSGDELILPGDLVRAVVGPRREVVRKRSERAGAGAAAAVASDGSIQHSLSRFVPATSDR